MVSTQSEVSTDPACFNRVHSSGLMRLFAAVLTLLMHLLLVHAADKKERDPTFRKQPQDVAASESVCAAAVASACSTCSKWLGRAQQLQP
jgi:hypothetical protein